MISHGVGIVVGNATRIGSNALLMHQVTLGAPTVSRIGEMPTVGDNVVIGAGAKVIGGVTVGDNVFIGVNAIVTEDVPSDSKVTTEGGMRISTAARPAPTAEALTESPPEVSNVS